MSHDQILADLIRIDGKPDYHGDPGADDDIVRLMRHCRELLAENERLREALKPFATIASVDGITADDGVQLLAYEYAPDTATVGDCRRAAELLKGNPE